MSAAPLPQAGRSTRRHLPLVLLAAVLVYGALLRFDAIALTYDPVTSPAWLRAVQQARDGDSLFRPPAITWTRSEYFPHRDAPPTQYRSDPYTYLQYAKDMKSFYAAHRREPLFPFATKLALAAVDQQDVAVSLASASFSLIAVAGTYLLGAALAGPFVGLLAALGMSIEYDVVTWSVGGWRDDAFTASLVLFAWLLVRHWQRPSRRAAFALGLAGGLACLTRITALSFILPTAAVMLMRPGLPWRGRARDVAAVLALTAILVGPFLFNCWRTFGDPFYAINVHADVYRATEGETAGSQTAREYLLTKARERPFMMLDTVAQGLTTYPFNNKWQGFARWHPAVAAWLPWFSLAGLLFMTGSAPWRLVLLLLVTSLVPFAATWRLLSDWRFTEHVYPFLLLAAALAFSAAGRIVRPSTWRGVDRSALRRDMPFWAAIVAGLSLVAWSMTYVLPARVSREALDAGEAVTIETGGRDFAFYDRDWDAPRTEGNVTTRVSRSASARVHLPLPRPQDYDATIRLDLVIPAESPGPGNPVLRVSFNGTVILEEPTHQDPRRMGAYQIRIPGSLVRPRGNALTMTIAGPRGPTTRIRLWYVRVRPPGA